MATITLNGILAIGTGALGAQQTALAVTSHNIANTNTEGYTRQRAEFKAMPDLCVIPGQIGDGVAIINVDRMRETLLDGNARQELGLQAQYKQTGDTGTTVESILGDPTNPTINKDLNSFFADYNSLTTSPDNLGVRQAVLGDAQQLTDDFKSESTQLTTLSQSLDTSVTQAASDINTMLQQVAVLNQQIGFGEGSGNNPNDALDQRDLLLDKLSNYMDLTVTNSAGGNGMVDITVNGKTLVQGINVIGAGGNAVTTFLPPAPGSHLEVVANDGSNTDMATAGGGQLLGIAQAHQTIDTAQSNLNDLAATFMGNPSDPNYATDSINGLCQSGFDLNGNTGVALFTGIDAKTIAVNPAVAANASLIVAADTRTSAGPPPVPNTGSNGIALKIALLQNTAVNYWTPAGAASTLPSATFNQAVTSIVSGLGSSTKHNSDLYNTYTNNINTIQSERQSQNGVSMDEEVSNMMAYQRAYEASAKLITIVDGLMGTVINMKAT